MKFFRWKTFLTTAFITVLPIFLGLALWNELPDTMAIHFNINNEPDNFAAKWFVVFMLPLFMVLMQFICCISIDNNSAKHGEQKKFEKVVKWIIPVMSMVLHVATLGYSLGWNIDIRKVAALIVAGEFLVTGNYLPKFDYIKNYNLPKDKARKINRFMGYMLVIFGLLFLISIFLPPVTTLICVCLLIPFAIISAVYLLINVNKRG